MTEGGLFLLVMGTLVLLVVFGALELLVRRRGASSEVTRRAAHVVASLFAILVHAVSPLWLFVVIAGSFVVLMALSRWMKLLTSIHNTRRASLGELYLPAGVAIASVIAGDDSATFIAAALVLGLADVAAGIVGDVVRSSQKTWRGSAAFVVVAFAAILLAGHHPFAALAVALAAAATEMVSSRGTDNLTVPVVTALLLVLL